MIPEWLISLLQGRADARERRRLAEWRAESPRHERRWRTLERLWRATEDAEPTVVTRRPTAEELLRARASPAPRAAGIRRIAPPPRRAPRIAVGAAAALLLAAAGWLALGRSAAPVEHVAGAEAMQTVRLADGSVVGLAPASRIEVAAGQQRAVRLEGRAFFAVAHDERRPFVVETDAARVRVLGTRFTLDAAGDTLRVAVVEGRVAVHAGGAERVLGSGEASVVVRGAPPPAPRPADVDAATRWLGSTIILQDTPLREAAAEMRRVHGLTLLIADTALAGRTVTAVFHSDDADEVLATLCRAVQARCERGDTAVVVRPE